MIYYWSDCCQEKKGGRTRGGGRGGALFLFSVGYVAGFAVDTPGREGRIGGAKGRRRRLIRNLRSVQEAGGNAFFEDAEEHTLSNAGDEVSNVAASGKNGHGLAEGEALTFLGGLALIRLVCIQSGLECLEATGDGRILWGMIGGGGWGDGWRLKGSKSGAAGEMLGEVARRSRLFVR